MNGLWGRYTDTADGEDTARVAKIDFAITPLTAILYSPTDSATVTDGSWCVFVAEFSISNRSSEVAYDYTFELSFCDSQTIDTPATYTQIKAPITQTSLTTVDEDGHLTNPTTFTTLHGLTGLSGTFTEGYFYYGTCETKDGTYQWQASNSEKIAFSGTFPAEAATLYYRLIYFVQAKEEVTDDGTVQIRLEDANLVYKATCTQID